MREVCLGRVVWKKEQEGEVGNIKEECK